MWKTQRSFQITIKKIYHFSVVWFRFPVFVNEQRTLAFSSACQKYIFVKCYYNAMKLNKPNMASYMIWWFRLAFAEKSGKYWGIVRQTRLNVILKPASLYLRHMNKHNLFDLQSHHGEDTSIGHFFFALFEKILLLQWIPSQEWKQ